MSYLENLYKDLLNKNEPDSYFAYVNKNGIRAEDKYHDALVKADTDKAISSPDYGKSAEKLDYYGLNKSGYEEYLRSVGEDKYLQKYGSALHTKMADESRNEESYQSYLSKYEALQTKISESLVKKIAAGSNFSIEDAFAEAVRAGISKSLAYATAEAGVAKAKENTFYKAVEFAKANGFTGKQAREYALELGLDDEFADRVYNEIATLSDKEKEFFANMSASEYFDYIQSKK